MNRSELLAPLGLGAALTIWGESTGASVALASLLAAYLLGALFPQGPFVAGVLVIAPQVAVALMRGAADSAGLFGVALLAGLVAVAFSALLGGAGAMTRRYLGAARSR